MRADRDQCPLPCKILVELVLEGDKGLISIFGKGDIAEDRAGYVRSNLGGLPFRQPEHVV